MQKMLFWHKLIDCFVRNRKLMRVVGQVCQILLSALMGQWKRWMLMWNMSLVWHFLHTSCLRSGLCWSVLITGNLTWAALAKAACAWLSVLFCKKAEILLFRQTIFSRYLRISPIGLNGLIKIFLVYHAGFFFFFAFTAVISQAWIYIQ